MSKCIFCEIAAGRMSANILYQDETVVAFKDINPQAPTHVLIIPKQHYESIREVQDEALIGHLFTVANKVAADLGVASFRYVINPGSQAGQTVFHLHLHLMGGRYMAWPPG